PPVKRGRAIANPNEAVLGEETAAQLHKHIGDHVTLAGGGASHRLRIVGLASFPAIGEIHAAHPSLGGGVLVAHQLVPGYDQDITGQQHGDFGPRAIFVRFRPRTDATAELARLRRTTAPLAGFAGLDVLPVQRPAEIRSSSTVTNLPVILASGLAVAML